MALTLDDDAVLLDAGIRMKFIRDAEYTAAPPLVGIYNDEQTLLKCSADGKLIVLADLAVPSIYPEVDMRARDITDVAQYLQVEVDPVTSRYALIVNDPRLAFDGDKLKVEATIVAAPTAGSSQDTYNEITAIAAGGWNPIVSYTVPAGKIFHLRHVSVSGTNKATYRVLWGGSLVLAKKRTYYTQFNEDFFFAADDTLGKAFAASTTVWVDVSHGNILEIGDFNATISGRLENV